MPKEHGSSKAGKKSWFSSLSTKRKLVYIFLLLFIVSWCFFLGFHVAGIMEQRKADAAAIYKITGADLNDEGDAYAPVELSGYRTILAVGYDIRDGYEVGRSDTIMVIFLNLDDKSVNLLSIPRDSYVYIPGGMGSTKINHAFAYGGVSLVKETVEYLLGITIDDYISIDFQGFQDVVDAVGGVDIYVDRDMINWDEGIQLYTGTRLLNGKQALGYCRYRGPDCSDYDRIKHQQHFIRELAKKLMSFSSLTKISSLVDIFMENVETSISSFDMLQLARYAFSMDLDGMGTYTVPGYSMYIEYGGYWLSHEIIDRSGLMEILNKIAGDDITFSPNVIDADGVGSYTIPEGGQEYNDDEAFYGGDSETDSGAEPVDGGESGEQPVDGGEGGGESGGESGGEGGGDSGGEGGGDSGGDSGGEGGGDSGGESGGESGDSSEPIAPEG